MDTWSQEYCRYQENHKEQQADEFDPDKQFKHILSVAFFHCYLWPENEYKLAGKLKKRNSGMQGQHQSKKLNSCSIAMWRLTMKTS